MHWAVFYRNVDTINALREVGADVGAKDNDGRIPKDWIFATFDVGLVPRSWEPGPAASKMLTDITKALHRVNIEV